ncbi:hypothetical protein P7C70_g371, partial [Phenoliferia sp. Uapishka_3]
MRSIGSIMLLAFVAATVSLAHIELVFPPGNCAVVDVQGTQGTAKKFTGPGIFRANTLGPTECVDVAGETASQIQLFLVLSISEHALIVPRFLQVVFPSPGPYVQYLGLASSSSQVTVLSPCDYDQQTLVTVTSNGSGESEASPTETAKEVPVASSTSTQNEASTSVTSPIADLSTSSLSFTAERFTTTSPAVTTLPLATPSFAPVSRIVKTQKKGYCSTSAHTSTPTTVLPSAPPAVPNLDASSGEAYIECTSTTTFSLCGESTCTAMGNVAAGTECRNGVIGFASKLKVKRGRPIKKHGKTMK